MRVPPLDPYEVALQTACAQYVTRHGLDALLEALCRLDRLYAEMTPPTHPARLAYLMAGIDIPESPDDAQPQPDSD